MFVQTDDDDTYVVDTDDLSQVGAVLLRLLAEGRTITPDLLPVLLHQEP